MSWFIAINSKPTGHAKFQDKVETPIHDNIRELVTWECKEHGVKSWMCYQIRKEVLGVEIWNFEGLRNFTQIFEARVL
jgi:hypothetical protein